MSRKKSLLIVMIIILGLSLLTACDSKKVLPNDISPNSPGGSVKESLEKVEELSAGDIEDYVAQNVQLSLEGVDELKLDKVHVREDKLRLVPNSYKKPLYNMDIDIYIDTDEELDERAKEEISQAFAMDLFSNLGKNNNLELMRLGFVNIIYDEKQENKPNSSLVINRDHGYLEAYDKDYDFEKDPDLVKLNKKVYVSLDSDLSAVNEKLKKANNEDLDQMDYEIARMGILGSDFIAEAEIYLYLGQEGDYEKELEEISENLFKSLEEDEELMQILGDKNVEKIKIEYKANWYKRGESLIYSYEL